VTMPKYVKGLIEIGDRDSSSLTDMSAQSGHHAAAIMVSPGRFTTDLLIDSAIFLPLDLDDHSSTSCKNWSIKLLFHLALLDSVRVNS